MESLKSVQSHQWLKVSRLGIAVGLTALLLLVLRCGLDSMPTAYANPGTIYVDGAIGQDVGTCGTANAPCQTISYALNNRAIGGDTIRVAQGVYTENLTVDKQIVLEGGYVPSGTLWLTRTGETVIDGSNSRTVWGDWDGNGLRFPFVIKDDNIYEMWYTGCDLHGVWRIGYLTSTDGINWTRTLTEPVLDTGSGDAWDSDDLEAPFVIKESPTSYKMWYSAYGGPDGFTRIGYATSTDGINWTKYPGNPVLSLGTDTWNNRVIQGPSISYEDGLYKMWLHTAGEDGGDWTPYMAYATSPNGITWTLAITNPLFSYDPAHYWEDGWIWSPNVLYIDGSYRMWYSAWGSDKAYIGHATSPDGWNWTKYNDGAEPVLSGTSGEWDEVQIKEPCVLYTNGVYTMWYNNETAIGVATSTNGISWNKYGGNPVLMTGVPVQWGQPVVSFIAGSDGSVLDGFTVRNGEARNGGGVMVEDAGVTIRHCTIISNTAHDAGGGIRIVDATGVVVESNQIISNTVSSDLGSGVFIGWSEVLLDSNLIAYNACKDYEHGNGAIGVEMADQSLPVTVTNNVVVSNTDKGIMVLSGVHDLAVVNNTIASNRNEGILAWGTITVSLLRNNIIASNGYCGIAAAAGAEFQVIDHNDVWQNGGGGGNYCDYGGAVNPPLPGIGDISADPLFVDAANGNYRLRVGSPCIDAGTSVGAPATDIEGTLRDTAPDIGAYEWTGFRIFLPLTLRNV